MVKDYQEPSRSASEIAAICGYPKPRGTKSGKPSFRVPCPAHGGDDPNLELWDKDDGSLGAQCYSRQCGYGPILEGFRDRGITISRGPLPSPTPLASARHRADQTRVSMITGEAPPPETPEAAAKIAAVASGEAPPPDAELLADYLNPKDNRSESAEADIARLMLYCGERVALVHDNDRATLLALDAKTGHWNDHDTLFNLLFKSAAAWRESLFSLYRRQEIESKVLARALKVSEQHKTEHWRKEIQSAPGAAYKNFMDQGAQLANVTHCEVGEVNGNLGVLGVSNGVVDLLTGQLIPPETARRHMVTLSTGVRYVKGATHPAIDKLLERQKRNPDNYQWFMEALGFALRGQPSRRLYFIVGGPAGGKGTALTAVLNAVGDYGEVIAENALSKMAQTRVAAGLTPELMGFTRARIAVDNEPGERSALSTSRLKKLSGGDEIKPRTLHQDFPKARRVSATMFITANTGQMPAFDMDASLDDRLRTIEWETIPEEERDISLRDAIGSAGAKEAMLSLLIEFAFTTERPPQDVPAVEQARQTMRSELVGDELAQWLSEHFVADLDARPLPTSEVWESGIQDGVSDSDSKGRVSVFGYSRRTFTDKVRTYFAGRTGKAHVYGKTQAVYFGIRRLADGEVAPPDLLAIGVEKDHEAGATSSQIHERVDVVLLKAEARAGAPVVTGRLTAIPAPLTTCKCTDCECASPVEDFPPNAILCGLCAQGICTREAK